MKTITTTMLSVITTLLIALIASLMVLLAIPVYGQETDDREELKFGVKVGFNYSNVYDREGEDFDTDAKTGLAAGVFVAIPLGMGIGIQPELLYSERGFKARGRMFGSDYEFTRTTAFIDVPLMLAFKPGPMLTILAGPQYSYLVRQKDVFDAGFSTFEQEQEFENDDLRRNMLCFTGGLDINLSNFVIGGRAGWDIQNNHSDGSSTTPRYKNVWYQMSIGYRF